MKSIGDPNRELDQVMTIKHHLCGLFAAAAVLSGSTGYGQVLSNECCKQPVSGAEVAVADCDPVTSEDSEVAAADCDPATGEDGEVTAADYNPATGEDLAQVVQTSADSGPTTCSEEDSIVCEPCSLEEPVMMTDELPFQLQSCECEGSCNRCCPRICWTATFEGLWFERTGADRHPLSFTGSNQPDVMSTRSLDYGTSNGYRATLARSLACSSNTNLELAYLGIDNWDGYAQVVDPGVLDSFLRVGVPNSDQFRNAYSHTVFGKTRLHSAEVNARRYCAPKRGWMATALAGFRYLHIDDDLLFLSNDSDPAVNPDDIGLYAVGTENNLVGGQIGGSLANQCTCRFSTGVKLKTGIFANFNEQKGRLLNVPAPLPPSTDLYSKHSSTSLSAVVETGLFAAYQLTSCVGVRAGYDVFIIDGLAMSANQLDYTANQFQGQSFVNDNSSLVFYGPTVGLWLNW